MKKQYLAAVSGGPDSMALLHKYHQQIKVVCSINYNKRQNAINDNLLVEAFCKQHNITFCLLNVTKQMYAQYHENNFQQMARKIRYNFFVETAKKYQLDTLLIAHHHDDWLETAYMQLNKHSHALYYGIKKRGQYHGLKILRPLLSFNKDQLLQYCIKHQLNYALDYTNDLDIYQRNQIRKLLKEMNWFKKQQLVVSIHWHNLKYAFLSHQVQKYFLKWKDINFNYPWFIELKNKQLQYHLIYQFLIFHNQTNNSQQKIQGILNFLKANNHKQYRLANNQKLEIKDNYLFLL